MGSREGARNSALLSFVFSSDACELRLIQEFADELSFLFVLDAGEKLCAQSGDCLWFIEWHLVIDFAARKMAGLTSSLKDRFDL